MMEKQVCSIVHEAYARQKGEFFVKKARAFFHPVANFIPKGFNESILKIMLKSVSCSVQSRKNQICCKNLNFFRIDEA